jgi:hypothetical protein
MDTTVNKPRQVATADLSQQEPHTLASSEEVRLAAGISTIGLQATRLSGAQRKKLTRERKMMEETWTAEKPPRKLHPKQRE